MLSAVTLSTPLTLCLLHALSISITATVPGLPWHDWNLPAYRATCKNDPEKPTILNENKQDDVKYKRDILGDTSSCIHNTPLTSLLSTVFPTSYETSTLA